MRAVTIHGPRDIQVEHVPDASLRLPTDAVVRVTHACICGSDLWAYRGVIPRQPGQRIGHEFIGVVEEVGATVGTVRRGDRVVVPFTWADGSCDSCSAALHTSCPQMGIWGQPGEDGAQGEAVRVPFADATLIAFPADTDGDRLLAVLTLADVMCTGHHGALAAGVRPGAAVAIVGDGAVGLCAVLAARRLGAERIVLLGHHEARARIASRFGATDLASHRAEDADTAVAQVRELTEGRGFRHVIEAVGTTESMRVAVSAVADGGTIGVVGVPHGITDGLDIRPLFYRNIGLRGGITPARAYIPELMPDVLAGTLDPSPMFDLVIGLDQVPAGYVAMDERRCVKPLIRV